MSDRHNAFKPDYHYQVFVQDNCLKIEHTDYEAEAHEIFLEKEAIEKMREETPFVECPKCEKSFPEKEMVTKPYEFLCESCWELVWLCYVN